MPPVNFLSWFLPVPSTILSTPVSGGYTAQWSLAQPTPTEGREQKYLGENTANCILPTSTGQKQVSSLDQERL